MHISISPNSEQFERLMLFLEKEQAERRERAERNSQMFVALVTQVREVLDKQSKPPEV